MRDRLQRRRTLIFIADLVIAMNVDSSCRLEDM